MHLYGTPQEKRDIKTLEHMGFVVVNPSDELHAKKANEIKASGMDAMTYFEGLVRGCDLVAFRSFSDGMIGAGVLKEIAVLAEKAPVIELPSSILERGLTIEQTQARLRENGQR